LQICPLKATNVVCQLLIEHILLYKQLSVSNSYQMSFQMEFFG